jgi:DNA helicase-2/ATP-dependent DNA helicase PcrA
VRGRIDAVYRDTEGGLDLVEWKTGRRPAAGQLKVKAVQLAVYRLAWARLKGVPLESVRAAFYYVGENQVVRPHDLGTAEQLEHIVTAALGGTTALVNTAGPTRGTSRPQS